MRAQAVTAGGLLVDDPNGSERSSQAQRRHRPRVAGAQQATAEGRAGEDFTWPWSQVEPHIFHWVAAIGR